MPMIHIEFDDTKVDIQAIEAVSKAVRDIVSEVTSIADVFVYANSATIKVAVAPIEIFVRMSDYKITDEKQLMQEIKSCLSTWKQQNNFKQPINLTLIPMHWLVEIDI